MVDVSGLLLSVSSLSFSVSLSLSWESSSTPFSEATSPSSSSSPLLLYPMNSPQNYSSSRKYFLYLDRCFLFLLNFCSWLNYYRFLTLQGPSRNVFSAQGLVTLLLWGSNTYSTRSAMFVTKIIRSLRRNCPPGVQKRILFGSGHTMQQFRITLFRHCLGKMTQNIFYSWFLIFAFRTFAFFMFTLVLFFNQIYLSLHFDEFPWET